MGGGVFACLEVVERTYAPLRINQQVGAGIHAEGVAAGLVAMGAGAGHRDAALLRTHYVGGYAQSGESGPLLERWRGRIGAGGLKLS